MSYDKAMRHARNVRKLKKQANMFMGFNASTTPWPNPRRDPETALCIQIKDWFKHRRFGDHAYNRECIRDSVAELRKLRIEKGQLA